MPSFSVYFRMDVEGENATEALNTAEHTLDNPLTPLVLHTDHMTDEMGEEVDLTKLDRDTSYDSRS
jgi:hypothetical protein